MFSFEYFDNFIIEIPSKLRRHSQRNAFAHFLSSCRLQ